MKRLLPDPPSRTGAMLSKREFDASLRVLEALRSPRAASILMTWDNDMQDALAGLHRAGYVESYGRGSSQKASAPYRENRLSATALGLEYLDSINTSVKKGSSHAMKKIGKKRPAQLDAEIAAALSGRGRRSSHATVKDDLYPTTETRRHVQTIRHRDEFPEILSISMRADGTNYSVKVPDAKNARGYDLVDVLVHHSGMRSSKSASRSRITPTIASKIVTRYLDATR